MERLVYLNELFDCYQSLLTEKEKECFLDYYQDDLTLQEIADNKDVSKNAVFKTVKIVEEKLETWENKLNILNNKKKIVDLLSVKDDKILKENITTILKDL